MTEWPLVPLGEVLTLQRRWVKVDPLATYEEIGVRCFGKGIFHKAPIDGSTLGNKRVLRIEPGDLVFNNVFAWEGAVAVASKAEAGKIGSHRFVTYTVDQSRCSADYLRWFFRSEPGLDVLRRVSPGSAGRNRTMSLGQLPKQVFPLPSLAEQQRLIEYLDTLSSRLNEAKRLTQESSVGCRLFWKALSKLARDVPYATMPLEQVVEFLDGRRVPLSETERASRKGPYPYYGASGIIDNIDDYIFDEDLLLLSEDGANLINRSTPIAFVASGKYWVNNHAHVLKPLPTIMSLRYLEYVLSDTDVSMFNYASAQAKLNQKNARQIGIPVPPLPEQERIVAYLDALGCKIKPVVELQVATGIELDALLPSVIARALNGEELAAR
jgi:type I restriction enzyme S subunit